MMNYSVCHWEWAEVGRLQNRATVNGEDCGWGAGAGVDIERKSPLCSRDKFYPDCDIVRGERRGPGLVYCDW